MSRAWCIPLTLLLAACSKTSGTQDGVGASSSAAAAASVAPKPGPTGIGNGGGGGGGVNSTSDAAPLAVVIVGGAPTTWSPAAFAPLPRFTIHADSNDKDAWSLRDLSHSLVGPRTRVTAAVDGDGERTQIEPRDWTDSSKTPVLRINRRGKYKIEWVDSDGNMLNHGDVRDVRSIEVSPSG